MITYELRGTGDDHRVHRAEEVRDIRSAPSVRPAGRAPVAASRTAGSGCPVVERPGRPRSARPLRARVAARPAAMCPSPVASAPRGPTPRLFRMRRIVAGVGLALASAATVVGLGLLADASSAANAPTAPTVVLQGS